VVAKSENLSVPPQVSICLPVRNAAPFLAERIASITAQTLTDWEVVALDGFSDDGSWGQIIAWAAQDPRVRAIQEPPDGIYPAFNRCIALATGPFIYIAPADDTMAPNCLEKMVAALDTHPECDLAHCPLRAIGDGAAALNAWWSSRGVFSTSSFELNGCAHIRRAPFDGLLHLYGTTVYTSITQLLIRRSLFDRIGCFDDRWGSIGDFHWDMRASLVANAIHIPDTWGGWRLHPQQATHEAMIGTPEHRKKIEEMIDDALMQSWQSLSAGVKRGLRKRWRGFFRSRWEFANAIAQRTSRTPRLIYVFSQAVCGSEAAWSYLLRQLTGRSPPTDDPSEIVRGWLRSVGIEECLRPV
jgi:glycosyltransferase involved in cell wall biosynthesis